MNKVSHQFIQPFLPLGLEQTGLVRTLLSMSKDIGTGYDPPIPAHQYEDMEQRCQCVKFRWLRKTDDQFFNLLRQAEERRDGLPSPLRNKLIDALRIAELVGKYSILDEVRWFTLNRGLSSGDTWKQEIEAANLPVLSTSFGVWVGWHELFTDAYTEVTSKVLSAEEESGICFEVSVPIQHFYTMFPNVPKKKVKAFYAKFAVHLPVAIEMEVQQFIEFVTKQGI